MHKKEIKVRGIPNEKYQLKVLWKCVIKCDDGGGVMGNKGACLSLHQMFNNPINTLNQVYE